MALLKPPILRFDGDKCRQCGGVRDIAPYVDFCRKCVSAFFSVPSGRKPRTRAKRA